MSKFVRIGGQKTTGRISIIWTKFDQNDTDFGRIFSNIIEIRPMVFCSPTSFHQIQADLVGTKLMCLVHRPEWHWFWSNFFPYYWNSTHGFLFANVIPPNLGRFGGNQINVFGSSWPWKFVFESKKSEKSESHRGDFPKFGKGLLPCCDNFLKYRKILHIPKKHRNATKRPFPNLGHIQT
jgi:hypothetical protein